MLEELSIRDYAIIDRLSVRFEDGLNVLSGETGAGKSILIGALSFILGSKTDTGIIRSGADEALVTALISLAGNQAALAWLAERGIETEDACVIIRRSLKKNGRSTAYIQSAPVVRQDLSDFSSLLVEIHGQRDGHALLRKERHRELLDRFGGLEGEVREYAERYAALGTKRKKLETIASSEAERLREIEFLRFALEEIDAAAVKPNEQNELEEEERRLSQYEKLFAAASQANELLSENDGAIHKLRKARTAFESAAVIDQKLSADMRRLDDAYYEFEDIAKTLSSYLDHMSFDAARLEHIETRLALLQKLKRKYVPACDDISALASYRAEAAEKLGALENWEEDRSALEAEISKLESDVFARAALLTKKRKDSAAKLENAVIAIIASLGMPHARFAVRIASLPPANGKVVVGPHGADDLEFYLSANKGEAPRALIDIASGGELSRFMLAMKSAFAEDGGAPAMVFDEIDTGIGGEVALAVGRHLAQLARGKQVLCITHLASIAARADNQYMVEKRAEGDRTVTSITKLNPKDRVTEIARMLSGDPSSKTSMDHAAELLAKLGTRGT